MQNSHPQFYVYNASAGSGKTFTITKEYLKLCLESKDTFKFKEILAITFTNKAAAEMKSRVLETLEGIASNQHKGSSKDIEKLLDLKQAAYRVLSKAYETQGDYKKALFFY